MGLRMEAAEPRPPSPGLQKAQQAEKPAAVHVALLQVPAFPREMEMLIRTGYSQLLETESNPKAHHLRLSTVCS